MQSTVPRKTRVMRIIYLPMFLLSVSVCACTPTAQGAPDTPPASAKDAATTLDPLITTWAMQNAGQYARVVQTPGGKPTTTWPAPDLLNHGGGQSQPAYADIQQVSYSDDWVYIRGTGLASHQMGPWMDGVDRIFGNWPSNQNYLRRFPRHPKVAVEKSINGLGALGTWANGVALFNLLDGFAYDPERGRDAQFGPETVASKTSAARWIRNAVLVEQPTFDASNAHQPGNGEYHYHDNPLALRRQLGDNVSYDAAANRYHETVSAAHPAHHSPILGWSYDGFPIYGPYGYADAKNPASGVRRMISGFAIRDGEAGTDDLRKTGRHTLARWSADLHGASSTTLTAEESGPDVSTRFPLGRYVEDYDFRGDHAATQGKDYDLDLYNGRFCVTPEFPKGTYAYFVTLNADGNPAFPYVIGRQYYGEPTGGQGQRIVENVTVYRNAGPNATVAAATLTEDKGRKSVAWPSTEGGHYTVESSADGENWTTLAADVHSAGTLSAVPLPAGEAAKGGKTPRLRAQLTSLDPYDTVGIRRQMGGPRRGGGGNRPGGGESGVVAEASPAAATRGEMVTVKFTFGEMPPPPPADIQPTSAKLGTLTAKTVSYDGDTVTATFLLTSDLPLGLADVSVSFPAPPGREGSLTFTGKKLFTIR